LAQAPPRLFCNLRYKGQVPVNVIGVWRKGHREPLWVMSNLDPEVALRIYTARLKVDETLRDLKTLLALDQLMNKSQQRMEQMAALILIAYTIGLLFGEALRDELFGPPDQEPTDPQVESPAADTPKTPKRRKWQLYSGLFILLKHKVTLSAKTWHRLLNQVLDAFVNLIHPPVRTHARTSIARVDSAGLRYNGGVYRTGR
jgi:hypothetical protein